MFWGIELVRYLISANSVLPEKAKQGDAIEFTNTIDYNYQERIEKEKLEKEKAEQEKNEQEKAAQKTLEENKLEESENNMSDNDIPEKADKKLEKDAEGKAGLENKTKESSTEDISGDIKK